MSKSNKKTKPSFWRRWLTRSDKKDQYEMCAGCGNVLVLKGQMCSACRRAKRLS